MATITRQQIIALINQYIYTNGNQEITAEQMHEILTDIANAFAMEGSVGAGGIDNVLATGSSVSIGRQITNSFGGKLQLAVEPLVNAFASNAPVPQEIHKYMGFNVRQDNYTGQVYASDNRTVIGGMQTSDAAKTFFNFTIPAKGEFYAGTVYELKIDEKPKKDDTGEPQEKGIMTKGEASPEPQVLNFPRGITSVAMSDSYGAINMISEDSVRTSVNSINGEYSADFNMSTSYVSMGLGSPDSRVSKEINVGQASSSVYDRMSGDQSLRMQSFSQIDNIITSGPQSTRHIQTRTQHQWMSEEAPVASIDKSGLILENGKRLTLRSGGSEPTSGVVTLASGFATVATSAIRSNSAVSLTVQDSGTYAGTIRVASRTPGSGFTISTGADRDNCRVFWQIIDIA